MIEALPPPYLSSKESIDSPYDPHDVSALLPFATHLPTSPLGEHRYSSRLRRLLQQRSSSRGVYLTLHIPHTLNNCKLISIESASTCSSMSSTSSTSSSDDGASIHTADTEYDGIAENLIHYTTSQSNCEKMPLLIEEQRIPFIEDLEAGRGSLTLKHAQPRQSALKSANSKKDKKRKRVKFKKDPKYRHRDRHAYGYIGSYDEERETSWLTFFLLLLLVFTMVCAAGVFIAWALGFAGAHVAASGAGVGVAAAGGATVGGVGGAAGKANAPIHIIPIVHADRPIQGVSVQNKVHPGKERRSLEEMLAEIEKRNSRVWRHQIKREPENDAAPVKAKLEKRRNAIKERTAIKEEYLQNTDMMW
ncbi:hypothetical protein TWF694_011572 [Orbilia ellipsospora]|uniref:Uncharacterized protein n=1 Tax=Orbilia ellipsospora TaxID=2528407 RepID=A0AAV9X5P0_9PEZI